MKLTRTVQTSAPPHEVAAYLSDFTTTNEWDPGTVRTELISGDGGVGTTYSNVSRFLGRESELTYEVVELVPGKRIVLVGTNKTVTARDAMTVEPAGDGSLVTYVVDFDFHGLAAVVAPLLRGPLRRLADQGRGGMQEALDRLGGASA